MKNRSLNFNNELLFLVLLISIFPVISISGIEMPLLYLFLPIGLFLLLIIFFGWYKMPKIGSILTVIFILISVEIIMSTLYGTVTKLGGFIIPTDILQYIARFLTVISFIAVFYKDNIKEEKFIFYFLIISNIAMFIGILQWIPWPGRELLVSLYPFHNTAYQLGQLNNSMAGIRVHGIAQHATANGGLAAFFFCFAFSVYQYLKKHRFLAIILMIFSVVNIFASQARAGMLAFVFSVFLFYLINIYIYRKSIKPTIYATFIIVIISLVGIFLYNKGNPYLVKMVYRWNNLLYVEQGGARVDQLEYFLSFMQNPLDYLLGLSKQVINLSAIPFGIEIEPANIFITYGVLGFVLQYVLIFVLLIYFLNRMRRSVDNKGVLTLVVAAFVGLASYQVFSVGYYFFREIRIGLFPWILCGVAIGVYERYKKNDEKNKELELKLDKQ